MADKYIYNENELKMIQHNVPNAASDANRALKALNDAVFTINQAMKDLEAAGRGHIPSERKEPTNVGKGIFAVPVREWVFDPTNVGNCHDCPFHANESGNGRCPCGARTCFIGKLCDLAGTR